MPTPAQLGIRASDPVLLLHDDAPPTYRRAGRDPYQMPGREEWLIRLVGVDGEGPETSTVELHQCQPLPPELGDLVALVDAQLISRDSATGETPGYVGAGEWSASIPGIATWTGAQMNTLYAGVLRLPTPIPEGEPCGRCMFAIRVPGAEPRPRGTQAPCIGCEEPQNSRHQPGKCFYVDEDATSLCSGALYKWGNRLVCGRHALRKASGLDDEAMKIAGRAREASRSQWRTEGGSLPSVERLLRWAHRVAGVKWTPTSSRSRA